jgi:hypothetical protein
MNLARHANLKLPGRSLQGSVLYTEYVGEGVRELIWLYSMGLSVERSSY